MRAPYRPQGDPNAADGRDGGPVDLRIEGRPRDVGGFPVRRLLPSPWRRSVGPFVFFDHMGPVRLAPGEGMDVRPHPHVGLATVTYLFEGAIVHRDSLGTTQTIVPGDVNWMASGRGITHSERSSAEAREAGARIHGIQSWVALPLEDEEDAPRFEHHDAASVPRLVREGATLDIVAGEAYGARSPVGVLSPTLYVHATLEAGATLPVDGTHEERALYVVDGAIGCHGLVVPAGTMIVLRPGADVVLTAETASRAVLIGGARLDAARHIAWNFVSSSRERIAQAEDDWRAGRFPTVPGDDVEFIPLPERIPR